MERACWQPQSRELATFHRVVLLRRSHTLLIWLGKELNVDKERRHLVGGQGGLSACRNTTTNHNIRSEYMNSETDGQITKRTQRLSILKRNGSMWCLTVLLEATLQVVGTLIFAQVEERG